MRNLLLNGRPTASDCAEAVTQTERAMKSLAVVLLAKQTRQSMVIALIEHARQCGNNLLANYMEAEAYLTFDGFKMEVVNG